MIFLPHFREQNFRYLDQNIGFRWRSINISSEVSIFPTFSDNFRHFSIFSPKFLFFPVFSFCYLAPKISKSIKKMLLKGFEPTQNAQKWHPLTIKPLIALIIYSANFFIFSYFLFVHNPYHHLIIIFYFIFILHYNL